MSIMKRERKKNLLFYTSSCWWGVFVSDGQSGGDIFREISVNNGRVILSWTEEYQVLTPIHPQPNIHSPPRDEKFISVKKNLFFSLG